MKRFEKKFGDWVVRYRWLIIIVTILAALTAASGMRFLTFSNDNRVFFSEENPQLQALESLENTYNKIDTVLFVLAPQDGSVFSPKTLAAVVELTEKAWQTPFSGRVDSISNFQYSHAEEDDLIVADLVQNPMGLTDADLEQIEQIALSEPQLINNAVSSSGDVTSVRVNILKQGESIDEIPKIAAFSRNLAKDFRQKYPDIDLHLTGGVMLDNAFGEAGQKDMATLVPLMFFTLVIVVGLALRSYIGTVGTLLVILLSMFTGLGLAGWLGITLTTASVNAPTIILTLAVADSVHLLVTAFQQMRQGKAKLQAIAESVRVNLQPVFLTSITTAIGFLSMNFSDAPPFRDLGNIVAMGVLAAFVYSVMFLPAMLAVLPMRIKQQTSRPAFFSFEKLADLVVNQRRTILWGMSVLILALIAAISNIELNDQFIKYFSKRYEIRQATDFVQENLTGWDIIQYSLDAGEAGGINDPAYLAKVESFANWYRNQPKVVHVDTITDTMKRLNKNMHGDDSSYYRLPAQRDLAAQYLLLYEMSLPFGLDLNNRINVDKSATRVLVTLRNTNTREQRQMDEKARQWLQANAPSMYTYGSGLAIIWAHISERNINSMLGATFGALVLISVILIFALKSFRIGVLSLIPNLAPAAMAFGIWGLLMGRVGLGLSIVASMTLGIVVDDTVHFLSKYLRARREYEMSPAEAVRYSYKTVGTAMLITTVALVAGFSVLAFSGFKMNGDMGMMAALTISLALVLDFFYLPILLMKFDGKSVKQTNNITSNLMEKSHETFNTDFNISTDAVPVTADSRNMGRNA